MNISKALKIKRDKEIRDQVTDSNLTISTIEDDNGNTIEIMDDDSYIATDAVTSLNTLVGDINVIPGNNITIDIIAPNTIRISSTGGGGVDPEPPTGTGKYEVGINFIEVGTDYELFSLDGRINE